MRLTDINDIKSLLASHGFRFSKSMGQNFLTAAWVPEDIAEAAQLDENTGVLEVGPGIGCLTEQLALRAGKVVAVELDNALRPVLSQTLAGKNNVEIIFGDVLKQDIKGLVSEKMQGLRPPHPAKSDKGRSCNHGENMLYCTIRRKEVLHGEKRH